MRRLSLFLVATAIATPALAQPAAPAVPVDTLKAVTKELSSDAYEGRAPSSEGEKKSVAYIIAQMKAAGLQPGNKGQWTQDVPMVDITAKNVGPFTVTGGSKPVSLVFRDDIIAGTYRVVPKISVKDSDMVFVGYGIVAPEKGWNDYAGVDVKGKTVVILINDPDWQTPQAGKDAGLFEGRAMTWYGRWIYKFEEAARQGAAAAIIVHDTVPAAYGWNVVQSSWTGAQQVADAPDGNMSAAPAVGWISNAKAQALMASAGQDLAALTAAAKKPGFKPIELGVKASVSFDNTLRRHASKNFIAVLPGRTRPEDYVLYTAHWDHLGRCKPAPDGDDICNGAVDNATGTAALVALAEAHARAGAPGRSIAFLAVTAEESGLLGSKYYAENPVLPLADTVAGVNMDALSVAGAAKNVVVIGKGKSELDALLDHALAAEGRVATREPTPEKGFYYRSDHFSLAKQGVPMLYFEGGDDLIAGGKAAGAAAAKDYEEHRYHGPKDEYDPSWDWAGIASDLRLYYTIGRELAEGDAWPNWVAGDEFRAARDRSRAGR